MVGSPTANASALVACLAIGLCVAAATGRGGAQTSQASVRTPSPALRYVALGDSYSAGEGLAPYQRGTRGAGCHRSPRAFAPRLAHSGRTVDVRAFVACTGALTDNVGRLDDTGALTGVPQADRHVARIQLDALSKGAWSTVDLVTVTIGGNDAGFGNALRTCLVLECDVGSLRAQILAGVGDARSKIAATYAAIRRRAPAAAIVVLGYPQLFPAAGRGEPGCVQGFSRSRQRFMREATAELEQIIRSETRRAGLFFASVAALFAGHEPCGRLNNWLIGAGDGLVRESYHPNAAGQRAYARGLQAFLRCQAAGGRHRRSNGLPRNPAPGAAASRCAT